MQHTSASGHFVKQQTMGTLESQAEIGVCVQAPGTPLRGSGVLPPENFGTVNEKPCNMHFKKSCNILHFGRNVVRNAVRNACTANSCFW